MPISAAEDDSSFEFSVTNIRLNNNQAFSVPVKGVTLVVGPNNAGKSTLLREIALAATAGTNPRPLLVESLSFQSSSSPQSLIDWLTDNGHFSPELEKFSFNADRNISVGEVARAWNSWHNSQRDPRLHPDQGMALLSTALVHHSTMTNRLDCIQGKPDPPHGQPAFEPLQRIRANQEVRDILSDLTVKFFRTPVKLDSVTRPGSLILRLGQLPGIEVPSIEDDHVQYATGVAALPTVVSQGDGLQSVVGILLPLISRPYRLALIDEPEAFLHPPQARLLGKELGRLSLEVGMQMFIATHDRNLLLGVLESSAQVNVLRMDRTPDGHARISQLSSDDARQLWKDPVLRYGDALDGLFYRAAVVAEGSGDARFFAASLENLSDAMTQLAATDIHFTSASGKDGILKIAKALRAAAVPTVISADLDALNDEDRIREWVGLATDEWDALKRDFQDAIRPLVASRKTVTCSETLKDIQDNLEPRANATFGKTDRAQVNDIIKADSPWHEVKRYGLEAFRGRGGGLAYNAASRLLQELDENGVVLVSEGELEGLAPEVERSKGPSWYDEAMASKAYLGERAKRHAERLIGAVDRQLR